MIASILRVCTEVWERQLQWLVAEEAMPLQNSSSEIGNSSRDGVPRLLGTVCLFTVLLKYELPLAFFLRSVIYCEESAKFCWCQIARQIWKFYYNELACTSSSLPAGTESSKCTHAPFLPWFGIWKEQCKRANVTTSTFEILISTSDWKTF